ncbi:hypothetical protein T484DRAFT_3631541, partial [Baffinella frigidus]
TRNPEPETRNPEPEARNPEPETRSPKPGTRNPEPETRNPKPETRDSKPGTRNPKPASSFLPAGVPPRPKTVKRDLDPKNSCAPAVICRSRRGARLQTTHVLSSVAGESGREGLLSLSLSPAHQPTYPNLQPSTLNRELKKNATR